MKGNRLSTKLNGEPLASVIWQEEGWILREVPTSYNRPVAAFHRHKRYNEWTGTENSAVECMLNTMGHPGWVCYYCNHTAPEGMQALFYMMNWNNL